MTTTVPTTATTTPTATLRVAHLGHSTAYGGAELALVRMLAASDGRWEGVLVLPQGSDLGPFAGLDPAGVLRVGPSHRAGPGARSGAVSALAGVVTLVCTAVALRRSPALRADVVHTNTTRAAAYGALLGRGRGKLVVHLRDLLTVDALGRYGFHALGLALRRADGVVANSAATLASARPYLPPGVPTLVLPSPLGLDAVRARDRGAAPAAGEPKVVGMVARLAAWKGQELLLEAFAGAYGGGSRTRLRLVGAAHFGDGDYAARLRARAAALGVADRVELPGHVTDVAGEIAAMDVCVQASTLPEPLGQNVLQYLALGRPTVVADAGGPLEWVRDGENGLVFRSGDVGSLAAVLGRLADPALRDRLAAGARATTVPTDVEVAAAFARFLSEVADR